MLYTIVRYCDKWLNVSLRIGVTYLARGLNGKSTAYTTIAYTTKAYTTIVHQVSPGPYYYWSVKMFKIGRYVTAEAVVPDEDHSINDFL